MKKTIVGCLLAAVLLFESCASQKINVHGAPGTVVTTLDGSKTLAVIDQSGTARIKLKRKDGYQAFLQAKAPGSDKNIPFALNYEDKDRSVWNQVWAYALVPTSVGVGVGAVGLWGFVFAPTSVIGGLILIFGRTGSDYDYDYLKHQTTNSDLIR